MSQMMRIMELMGSSKLIVASKICMIGGALLVLSGILAQTVLSSIQMAVGLDVIGVLTILLGFYLRKKALELKRRFDWRESYVSPQQSR